MELEERIVCGGHDVTDLVIQRLKDAQALNVLRATKQIAAAQRAGGERRILRDARGSAAGAVKMMIPPASYHYWGQRLGYGCWKDRAFCAEFLRDNAACRVKTVTERPMFAMGSAFSGKRETIKYEERKAA